MLTERLATIRKSLDHRQPDLTVIMENVRKPHNLAAVARTLEAVGGLEIHAITQRTSIQLTQLASGGVRKWVPVQLHASTRSGIRHLQHAGFQVIATVPGEASNDYRDIDYTQPTAILVGEELEGISEEAIELADTQVSIPIVGLVQSLNVSIATALILYEAYRQREAAGYYQQRRLDDDRYRNLLFEACHPKVANYCKRKALPYPAMDEAGNIVEAVADSHTHSDASLGDWLKATKPPRDKTPK